MDFLPTIHNVMEWNNLYKKRVDELPHWEVDGEIYYNKLQALALKNNNIKFRFAESQFTSFDNTSTIDDRVYLSRLMQLKNKYDYLRLFYSGGADSKLILDTAYANKILIHEIVLLKTWSGKNADEDEIQRAQLHIKRYSELFPESKISILELNLEDWKTYHKNFMTHHGGERRYNDRPKCHSFLYLHSSVSELLWKPYKAGLKHCDIVGCLTTKVIIYKDKPYWYILDNDIEHHLSPFIEYFYTSPNMPQVQLFQARCYYQEMLKYGITNTDMLDPDLLLQLKKSTGRLIDDGFKKDFSTKGMHKNIVDGLAIDDPELWTLFRNNIDILKKSINDNWLQIDLPYLGTVGIFSKLISLYDNVHLNIDDNIFAEVFIKGRSKKNEHQETYERYLKKITS